jgi:phytoene synthase
MFTDKFLYTLFYMATFTPQTWEKRLLSLAYQARPPAGASGSLSLADLSLLPRAYAACEAVTAQHSKSFHTASGLLAPEKRRAIRALYALCRTSDDLVDLPAGNAAAQLASWRRKALSPNPDPRDLILVAWTDTRLRYNIPQRYVEQLLDGVKRDLDQNRYATFEELAAYAYGVASTVGLMSMHITGFSGPEAIPYAIKLGVALQLTNILRDVGEDFRAGRIYLPQEELRAFGLTEADIAGGQVQDRWRSFMRFQIERNRRLYAEAWSGLKLLSKDGRLAVAAAAGFYQLILKDIEAHDYDVFNRRANISAWGKLRNLPTIWWRSR